MGTSVIAGISNDSERIGQGSAGLYKVLITFL